MPISDWRSDVCSSVLVLAISGEGLADEVEIQVPADQTIDRIGYVGIDRALARPEIEPGIGRDSQLVALADLRKQACIAAIAFDVRIVHEAAGVEPQTRTEAEAVAPPVNRCNGLHIQRVEARSDERRDGKEWGSKCRFRRMLHHYKKKTQIID